MFSKRTQKSYLGRHALPLDAGGSGNEHAALSSIPTRGAGGNLAVLVDADGAGLVYLAAEVSDQSLQGGNVLDLQVVLADAAGQHCFDVELLEKRLEDVGDAQARQEVPLRDGLAHTERDVALVPTGRETGRGHVTDFFWLIFIRI